MLQNLIVIAKHGDQYIDGCLESLGAKYPIQVIDTKDGGHPTGAYLKAYREYPAKNYLFIQDSMQALQADYLEPFIEKMPEHGAVAWGLFPMAFDSREQVDWVESHYDGVAPEFGIFGPIFYTSRDSLKTLEDRGLLPPIPKDKLQAQGTERMWAWAFQNAELPVESVGGIWSPDAMSNGAYPPFRKIFGGRV